MVDIDVRVKRAGPIPRLKVGGQRRGGRFKAPRHTLVEFEAADFEQVDFSGTRIDDFVAERSTFRACDFSRMRIGAGTMGADARTAYIECHFDRARLAGVDALFARFERCSFDHADLKQFSAVNAEFVDCHFAGRVESVGFAGAPDPNLAHWIREVRTKSEFRGNDFTQAELIDCTFGRGVDLSAQKLPESNAYIRLDRIRERIPRTRAKVSTWQDDRAREEALLMLRLYEMGSGTQDELFARRDDMKMPPQIRDRVWELLSEPLTS